MKRVEIITNQAISSDMLEELELRGAADNYTYIPKIHGRGSKGTRLGSALWPEENCMYLLYLDEDLVPKVKAAVKKIKTKFPDEGTKCFFSSVDSD